MSGLFKGGTSSRATTIYAVVLFVAFIGVLQAYLEVTRTPSYIFPTPSEIFIALIHPPANLLQNVDTTLYEIGAGFVLALILGAGLAILVSLSDLLRRVLYPYILILQIVPKVAIAPLLVIWFGFGSEPKIVLTFLIAFFPIFVDTLAGLNSLKQETLDVMAVQRASKWQVLSKARLPNALPFIFSGMKTGVTLAVVGAVVAEFISSNSGLGYLVLAAMIQSNTPLVFATIILISLIGIILFAVVEFSERKLIPWYSATRGARRSDEQALAIEETTPFTSTNLQE
jgi:NitT/TauT family transport system permease protein